MPKKPCFLKHRIPVTYFFVKPLAVLVSALQSKGGSAAAHSWLDGAARALHAGWRQAEEDEGEQRRVCVVPRCKPGRGRRMKHSSSPWAASRAAAAASRGLWLRLPSGQEDQSLPSSCTAQHLHKRELMKPCLMI